MCVIQISSMLVTTIYSYKKRSTKIEFYYFIKYKIIKRLIFFIEMERVVLGRWRRRDGSRVFWTRIFRSGRIWSIDQLCVHQHIGKSRFPQQEPRPWPTHDDSRHREATKQREVMGERVRGRERMVLQRGNEGMRMKNEPLVFQPRQFLG